MSKLVCRCGFAARDESWPGRDERLVTVDTLHELARDSTTLDPVVTASDRLLRCPNCGCFILDTESGTSFLLMAVEPPLIRVEADAPRDALGRVLLSGPLAVGDIEKQSLILGPGLWVALLVGDTEILGTVELAVGTDGEFTEDWVVTPGARFDVA